MLNKKYRNFFIIFIIVIILNMFIKNLTLSLFSSGIFLFLSLRQVLRLSKKNNERTAYDNTSYIICFTILCLSIVWLVINLLMIALVSAAIKIIKELIKWVITFI